MHVQRRSICALSAMAHALMTDPDSSTTSPRKSRRRPSSTRAAVRGARRVQEQIETAVERAKTD